MSPALQAKLLHVLESGQRPPGRRQQGARRSTCASSPRPTAICAQRVREGTFREDLLYRLDVVRSSCPPLRHRREDIRELLEHFLADARAVNPQSPVRGFTRERSPAARAYRWPGNVRELAHVVEKLVLFASGEVARAEDVPDPVRNGESAQSAAFQGEIIALRELDRRYTAWAVGQTGGHRGKAAEKLGIDPKTLRKLLDGAREDGE